MSISRLTEQAKSFLFYFKDLIKVDVGLKVKTTPQTMELFSSQVCFEAYLKL